MDNKEFKTKFKMSACTSAPWEYLIPFRDRPAIMRQIRQECIDIYGHDFDECPKRMVCLSKSCIGRPLPWKSPTARPYLEQLTKTQDIRNEEMFIKTDCSTCPIFDKCQSPCYQVLDFIARDSVKEPTLYYKSDEASLDIVSEPVEIENDEPAKIFFGTSDIPWDCLSDRKQTVVRKYLFSQLDFKYIADQLGLTNQASCKYEFYAAMTKLSEFAVMRQFLKDHGDDITDRQLFLLEELYSNNKNYTQLANELSISKQSIQQTVKRVTRKFKVKWTKFVTKRGNRTIYNVPELFK